ncbi:MAG: DUF1232 domain-containing protein [Deltaproteobacteria bacterium]|nr:DUF1232 domain-containing protein [Deltaproteobacteria bacterium]
MSAQKVLPLLLRPRTFLRMLVDPKAPKLARVIAVASLAYAIWPFDVLPDILPLVGYLDDLGVLAIAMGYLFRQLDEYDRTKRLAAGGVERSSE